MAKVKEFNRGNISDMREALNIALKTLEAIGITVEVGTIRYNTDELHTKITLAVKREGQSNAKGAWDRGCSYFGFKPAEFKETFSANGRVFTFVRFDTKKHKYPVIAACGGKQYKLSIGVLQHS